VFVVIVEFSEVGEAITMENKTCKRQQESMSKHRLKRPDLLWDPSSLVYEVKRPGLEVGLQLPHIAQVLNRSAASAA
jgi:hypothetical protein